MGKYGEILGTGTVRFERLLPGPIERAWSYVVDADKRARWLCGGDTELHPGGHVDLLFNNATLSDEPDDPPPVKYEMMQGEIAMTGKVTRCDPPTLLAHTWEFEDHASEVCYELSEQGDEVLLVVTHTRMTSMDETISACAGWHTHLDILGDVLEGNARRAFWKTHTLLEAEYTARAAS